MPKKKVHKRTIAEVPNTCSTKTTRQRKQMKENENECDRNEKTRERERERERKKSTIEQKDKQITHACKKRKFEDFSFETKGKLLFEKKKENESKEK